MVYESDFYTTRRSYTRPSVSSYTISYPRYSPRVTRVYTTTYPIYSYNSLPYISHKRLVYGTRILSTPVRYFTSPIRYVRSPSIFSTYLTTPARIITTPTRVIVSPARVITTPSRYITSYTPIRELSPIRDYVSPIRDYVSPLRDYVSPLRDYVSPLRYYLPPLRDYLSPFRTYSTLPSVLAREYARIANKYRSSYLAYRPLEDYLNTHYAKDFDDEKRRIRTSAGALLRAIHSPVPRAKSVTPFPLSRYEPISSYALDAYISRITNPTRYVQDFSPITYYPDPPKFSGKSHLASVRIVGNMPYPIRNPLYDPDRIRLDVEYLSHYLKNRRAASEKNIEKIPMESVDAVEAKQLAVEEA